MRAAEQGTIAMSADANAVLQNLIRKEIEAIQNKTARNWYTEQEAAEYMRVAQQTMRNWRNLGRGPRYFRKGKRFIRYKKSDLDDWLLSQAHKKTPAGKEPLTFRSFNHWRFRE